MIAQNDFARQWDAVGPAVMRVVQRVGASGRYILGREVDQFEKTLAEFWGVSHAVGVGNGMDALEIALRCLRLQAGDKVLTTSFSAFATTLAILRAGGIPVFVDVDDNGNIDLSQCREVLAGDRSIRFFLPVHLYGNPLDLEKLLELKTDFDLVVVEDCAQAISAKDNGRAVGTVGQAAGTSFYPTKNLGAFGDGGALLTNDGRLAERAKMLRNYGQSSLYAHDERGLNSRLDELHAAILSEALLPNLEAWTGRRRQIAARYQSEITNPALRMLRVNNNIEPAWHLFPLFTHSRDRLHDYLQDLQIGTGVHYPLVLPDQKALQQRTVVEVAVEPRTARNLAAAELSIPIHPFLKEAERTAIIDALNRFVP